MLFIVIRTKNDDPERNLALGAKIQSDIFLDARSLQKFFLTNRLLPVKRRRRRYRTVLIANQQGFQIFPLLLPLFRVLYKLSFGI